MPELEKISRTAFFLYILFISMAPAHHLLVDPGFGPSWKVVNTSDFMHMAVLASMIHSFTVPAGLGARGRRPGGRADRAPTPQVAIALEGTRGLHPSRTEGSEFSLTRTPFGA